MEISKKNAAIKSAAKSYGEANYEKSIEDHLFLTSEFGINSPETTYNLGLSYQYAEKNEEAQRTFMSLLNNPNPMIASFASNHNGLILAKDEKYKEALEAFKYALIKDSQNEAARYNYELLARWLEENQDQQDQEDEGENDENQDEQDQEEQEKQEEQDKKDENKKNGEGEEEAENDEDAESEKKEDKEGEKSQNEKDSQEPSELDSDLSEREKAMEQLKEKLKEMNLTPEQASQILDAMNAAELRYIQQNRKKATKRPDKGLPDW
ncbi:hypothetical protein [Belliella aquatica]|uniref:Tetratricopeptide repeat protein n=1 Tax=Belliella aquatica TaxID=1323734 RepID=A0ABQ1LYM9_9BACT|nr:hypothetical protein [Belliella aquatica]MCH7405781.1 hypothetical protein [Belliella aquatica]GGC30747.1 hypothetical protein GCM10010993_07130 [Belliella aquatica]